MRPNIQFRMDFRQIVADLLTFPRRNASRNYEILECRARAPISVCATEIRQEPLFRTAPASATKDAKSDDANVENRKLTRGLSP
jgi:hypothetical protein